VIENDTSVQERVTNSSTLYSFKVSICYVVAGQTSIAFHVPDKYFFSPGATQPIVGVYFTALYRTLASSRTRLLDHTQRRAIVGRTPLN